MWGDGVGGGRPEEEASSCRLPKGKRKVGSDGQKERETGKWAVTKKGPKKRRFDYSRSKKKEKLKRYRV